MGRAGFAPTSMDWSVTGAGIATVTTFSTGVCVYSRSNVDARCVVLLHWLSNRIKSNVRDGPRAVRLLDAETETGFERPVEKL